MSDLLERLLDADAPNVLEQLPTKKFEVKRLTKIFEENVDRDHLEGERPMERAVFTLRALPYGRVQDIRRMPESEQEIQILPAGCVDPDLRSARLMARFDAATPVDAVRSLLLPGEIADLTLEIERLSGYRRRTIDEVKND